MNWKIAFIILLAMVGGSLFWYTSSFVEFSSLPIYGVFLVIPLVFFFWYFNHSIVRFMKLPYGSSFLTYGGIFTALLFLVFTVFGISRLEFFRKTWDMSASIHAVTNPQILHFRKYFGKDQIPLKIRGYFTSQKVENSYREWLTRLTAYGFNFSTEFYDPIIHVTKAKLDGVSKKNLLVMEYNNRIFKIDSLGEEVVENAFFALLRKNKPKVCVAQAHVSPLLDSSESESFSLFAKFLEHHEWQGSFHPIRDLDLSTCDCVILLGQEVELTEKEVSKLSNLQKSKIPFLVASGAFEKVKGLNHFLKPLGVQFSDSMVILSPDDSRLRIVGRETVFIEKWQGRSKEFSDFYFPFTPSLAEARVLEVASANVESFLVGLTSDRAMKLVPVSNISDLESSNLRFLKSEHPLAVGSMNGHESKSFFVVGANSFLKNEGFRKHSSKVFTRYILKRLIGDDLIHISWQDKQKTKEFMDLTSGFSAFFLSFLSFFFAPTCLAIGFIWRAYSIKMRKRKKNS